MEDFDRLLGGILSKQRVACLYQETNGFPRVSQKSDICPQLMGTTRSGKGGPSLKFILSQFGKRYSD